jgi:hypothetical protein
MMQMNYIVIFMLTFSPICSLNFFSLLAFVHNLAHFIHNVHNYSLKLQFSKILEVNKFQHLNSIFHTINH